MAQVFCDLQVLDSQRISPSMHQVTIGGADLDHFPKDQAGGYFKLILEPASEGRKALMRTYTIRRQRERELDVLFALHGGNAAGPATSWALEAESGDPMTIRGPGAPKPLPEGFDFYLIAGDMAALPAISANLEAMDRAAKGVAVLEIQHEDDAVQIDAPDGIELRYILNPLPGTKPELLADALRAVERPAGRVAAWAACEFSGMRKLRAFLRDELALTPRELYISSYWKHGLSETEHKVVKREDAETQDMSIQ
ncbi:MAG: siderophore-interacting protein [Pseudomonadota bacterium]